MKPILYLVGWHASEISGTATVFRELCQQLPVSNYFDYQLILSEPSSSEFNGYFPFKSIVVPKGNLTHQAWLNLLSQTIHFTSKDLFFFPSLHLPKTIPFRFTSLIHDVLPLHEIDYQINPFKRLPYLKTIKKHLFTEKIITVSHFSKQEILKVLKLKSDMIQVIPNGVSQHFHSDPLRSHPAKKGVLYIGDLRQRKNVYTLAKAYLKLPSHLRETHPFMFNGEGPLKTKIIHLFKTQKASHQLLPLGKLSMENLIRHYQAAAVFVFPSLFEGFGLPIIEAQASGTAVICGRNSCLPEIGADSVTYADVKKVNDLCEKMTTLLTHVELRTDYENKGLENSKRFDWENSAMCYHDLFEKLLKN